MTAKTEDEGDMMRPLAAAMRALGWLPPTHERDVTEQLEHAAQAEPLPEALADPQRVFDARHTTNLPAMDAAAMLSDPLEARDVDAGLRRAAREGGDLPPEVLERMRRDRRETEQSSQRSERNQPPSDTPEQ